jgi:hypothetical protein
MCAFTSFPLLPLYSYITLSSPFFLLTTLHPPAAAQPRRVSAAGPMLAADPRPSTIRNTSRGMPTSSDPPPGHFGCPLSPLCCSPTDSHAGLPGLVRVLFTGKYAEWKKFWHYFYLTSCPCFDFSPTVLAKFATNHHPHNRDKIHTSTRKARGGTHDNSGKMGGKSGRSNNRRSESKTPSRLVGSSGRASVGVGVGLRFLFRLFLNFQFCF